MRCFNCCDSNDITLPEGQDGVGISSITLNGSNQFVINYTNGTSVTTSAVTITATGTNILHNDTTAQTETITSGLPTATALGTFSYTLPLNTVTTNGSKIIATAWFGIETTALVLTGEGLRYQIGIDGAWFPTTATDGLNMIGDIAPHKVKLVLEITRVSNTSVFCEATWMGYTSTAQLSSLYTTYNFELTPGGLGAIDFTSNNIVIAPYVKYTGSAGTLDVKCYSFSVEHYRKA